MKRMTIERIRELTNEIYSLTGNEEARKKLNSIRWLIGIIEPIKTAEEQNARTKDEAVPRL